MTLLFNVSHQKSVAIPLNLICNPISNTPEWFRFPWIVLDMLQYVEHHKNHVLDTLQKMHWNKHVFVVIQVNLDNMKGYKETHMTGNALRTTREGPKGALNVINIQQSVRMWFLPRGLHIYIGLSVTLNCNSGIFLMVFCCQETRNLLINHGQFQTSDKPDEQEKLSKSSRTCIVHPSNCLRNSTAPLTTGNSSRVPSVISCSVCCGDAACSIYNSSLEKRSCQRAA